ncbi:hypothetical protein N7G274_010858 [Stereocaulon virgatum]|uniref:Uncharacterized protein n=1 Tax=Stereocaulon virgatum TaxID=373712 RepID=A0ABR3ZST3_9LECA
MLITDLGQQHIILGKPWMNKHKVLLDMADDRIVFIPGRCDHTGAPQPERTTSCSINKAKSAKAKREVAQLPPPKPTPTPAPTTTTPEENKALDIKQIGAAAFHLLASDQKKYQVQCFSMTFAELDRALQKDTSTEAIRETTIHSEDDIRRKLPKEYHDLIDVFDRNKAKS